MNYIWNIIASFFITASLHATQPSKSDDHLLDLITLMEQQNLRLIVIRHGEATHNLKRLVISSRSPGIYLTEKGIEQVKAAGQRLKNQQIDHVFVSPVYRTLQTAQLLVQELDITHDKIEIDERLREQFFGTYEGKTFQEYSSYFSQEGSHFYGAVPQGEAGEAVAKRTQDFLHAIAKEHANKTLLIVTHAFNCVHIGKCLTGKFPTQPVQAEYCIYDFTLQKSAVSSPS